MNISVVGITKTNIMDVITDDSIYVIKNDCFDKSRWQMRPIKSVDVKDLLSDDTLIIKIESE